MAAAAASRFCIREYAARARAWPFGGDAGALPPMEVRRFRWWADEAAAVEEEEREVERRTAAKRRKRSVAELFAAVPRVAGGQGKRAIYAKEKGKLVLTVDLKATKGAKKKKKKIKVPTGIAVSKKEKSSSAKVTSIRITQLFPDSTRKRKPNKSLSNKKRNQEVSILEQRCEKGNKNSVSDSKKNAMTKSVQSQTILDKQSKVAFDTLLNNKDATHKPNSSCKPKHVTFSHGNDIFGWTLPEDNTTQPKSVETSQRPFQEGHGKHGREELHLVYQRADATPGAFEEDTSSLSETVVSTGVSCIFPGTKPKVSTIVDNSVDLNHCSEISNSNNYLTSSSLAFLSSQMASQNFDGMDSHLDDAEGFRKENHVISQPQGPSNPVTLAVKERSNNIYRGQLSQSSSSCLNDRSRSTLQEVLVPKCHLGKVHHNLVRSGKDVVSNTSSLAASNKTLEARATDCVPACKNTYLRDDYVGLPLNSRGEFVKPHPDGITSSIDILKRQCFGESSSYPSSFPTFFCPRTSTDSANLRPKHHVPQIERVDQSPHCTPNAPIAYEKDFRQLSCSERMKTNKYAVLSSNRPCSDLQQLSSAFCSECMAHNNPQQKLLGMQSYSMRGDGEHNTLPTAETTMRLMGKTVTLGSSGMQCRYPDNETLGCSKQTPAEDHSFLGTARKAFPQSFHGELVYPPYALRISRGERELPANPSFLPSMSRSEPRSELETNIFRTDSHNQQPELAAANRLYVQPAAWRNESELQHQQPVRPNQFQCSSAEDMLSVSMHRRDTQSVAASVPPFNRRNSGRNFVEKRPVPPYQPSYFMQHFSNVTQRNPVSSSVSGYAAAVQSSPGLTSQTKFTSLPPLPPSLTPSPVYSPDHAQPHGSTANHPSLIPAAYSYPASKSNGPGNALSRDERVKWTVMGSNVEGLGHIMKNNRNGKRPADKGGDVLLASPKKPCTAAEKDLNMLRVPERGLQLFGSRPDAQPVDPEAAQPAHRLGRQDAHAGWSSYPVNTAVRPPVKLKPGARHVLEPSGSSSSSMSQEDVSWPVHSVMPVENAAAADFADIYKF